MAAILDFGYLQKSKHLNNVSGRFLIPQNICLDTLLVLLVCMVRKLWSKYENGGHFGRHLGFWRMPTRDYRGLFISDSTHIPGPILKKSACYQRCPPFGALWPNTTGLLYETFSIDNLEGVATIPPPSGHMFQRSGKQELKTYPPHTHTHTHSPRQMFLKVYNRVLTKNLIKINFLSIFDHVKYIWWKKN